MKRLVFENVQINGFDGKIYREYNNYGKPTRRRYSVLCEMTDTQKEAIFQALGRTPNYSSSGGVYFNSNEEIPVFDANTKLRIEEPLNFAFIADVSVLVDTFTNSEGEEITYSRCLAILYKSKIEGVTLQEKKEPLKLETFDDFFDGKKISDTADLLESIIDNEPLPF